METTYEFTDRYGLAGPPSLRVGCRGDCEATGFVPIYMPEGDKRDLDFGGAVLVEAATETDARYAALWREAEAASPSDDGWHFVKCPDCGGTGITEGRVARVLQFFYFLRMRLRFARGHLFVRPYSDEVAERARAWQEEHAPTFVETGEDSEPEECPFRTCYGDRLDVPHPWWFNRRIAVRVLLGRV